MHERERVPRPFLFYSLSVLVAGLAAFAFSFAAMPPTLSVQAILLVAAVILSENFAFSLPPYTVSLSYPLTMAAIVLCGPSTAAIVAAVSSTSYRDLRDRRPLSFLGFNLGQLLLTTSMGAWVYMSLGGRVLQAGSIFEPLSAADFPAILVPLTATAVFCVAANFLLAASAMTLLRGNRIRENARTMVTFVPTQVALSFVGYLIAQVLAINPVALPLFVAPLFVARQLYLRFLAMKSAYADTVRSLIGALEAKDPYTRGHSERVALLSVQLGEHLGFDTRDLERLEYVALLHDLGKLAVPVEVLTKPGPLSPEEMEFTRQHPARGAEMIRRIPPLKDLADDVGMHHEWYGGAGYPSGIAAPEISQTTLILTIADCYDAMTTTRAYRPALSRDEAIAELVRCASTQFDPDLVRAFIEGRIGAEELALTGDQVEGRRVPLVQGGD